MQAFVSDSPVSTDDNLQGYTNHYQADDPDVVEEEEEVQSPRPKSNLGKMSIHERSLHGMRIFIARNAYPRTEPKRYILTTFNKLLSDAMNLVGLNGQAKKVFKKDGTPVNSIEEINENDVLYISSGEKFGYGYSPVKKQLPKYDKITKNDSKGSPRSSQAEPSEGSEHKNSTVESPIKTKEQIRLEHKQNRFQNELLSFHRALTTSPRTVDQCLRESSAAIYAQLLENQRLRLPKWDSLQAGHDQTQVAMLMDHLIYHHICPSTAVTLHQVNDWAMDLLKNVSVEEIKFAFFGPRQSGKTTSLYTFTTMLMRKLQQSNAASQYLFFPLNFETITLELPNIRQILRLYIKNTFDSLEYSHFAFLPFLAPLRKWFTFTVFGSTAQFPSGIEKQFPEVNIQALQDLAKKIYNVLHNNTTQYAIKIFLDAVFSLPSAMASALGLSGVIYILDSFEFCDKYLIPSEDCFPEATKPVSISQSLCEELQKNSYVVSYQDENLFMNSFTCNDAELIQIENLVDPDAQPSEAPTTRNRKQQQAPVNPEDQNDPPIIIRQPVPLRLSKYDCLGCPGLLDKYHKLVKLIRSNNKNKTNAPYSLNRNSSEYFRDMIVKKEIIRFATLLYDAGSDLVNVDILNKFTDESTNSIVAKLDETEEDHTEEEQNSQTSQNQSQTQLSSSQVQISQNHSQSPSVINDPVLTSPKKSSRPQSRASQKQREPSSPSLVTTD